MQFNIELSEMFEDLSNREYIFMQDGAQSHTSRIVKDWLHSQCSFLDFWPPNSPDLNPIEMVWSIMKRRLDNLPPELTPTNMNDFKLRIQEI